MTRGIVISLCDRSGHMVEPWTEAGYDAITVDLQAAESTERRQHLQMDVCDLVPSALCGPLLHRVVAVFAFPPCTHTAVSGARWFQDKGLEKLIEALTIVNACRKICDAKDIMLIRFEHTPSKG